MAVALVTGATGLIGYESSRHFASLGMHVVGIDNDMRSYFFGPDASTAWRRECLEGELENRYEHVDGDIRDQDLIDRLFRRFGKSLQLIVHAAAQPSHDWAAREPHVDFTINANGTLNLLEATRRFAPTAAFIFTSTNKVYGDAPNRLPLVECETRWEIESGHRYSEGIDESFPIDQSLHSLFGASKVAADVLVQEYGRYFGLRTATFRGGCLTGPHHSGAELHGFLAYLMKCTMTGTPYRIFGYRGKQVRDNIHSHDLIQAFHQFFENPRSGRVYNIGGGRFSHCSMLEAIQLCEEIAGRPLDHQYVDQNRKGDHIWYVSDVSRFQRDYPQWRITRDVRSILQEIHDQNRERWELVAAP